MSGLQDTLANSPVLAAMTAMCERIEIQEREDLALLDTTERDDYARLLAKGMTHSDAIWWLGRARPLRASVKDSQ